MWYFRFLGWLGEQSKFEGHRHMVGTLSIYTLVYTASLVRLKGQGPIKLARTRMAGGWSNYNRLQNCWDNLQNFGIFLMNFVLELKKYAVYNIHPRPPWSMLITLPGWSFRVWPTLCRGEGGGGGGGGGDVLPGVGILNSQKMVKRPNSFAIDCTLGSVIHCGSLSTQPITTEGTRPASGRVCGWTPHALRNKHQGLWGPRSNTQFTKPRPVPQSLQRVFADELCVL